MSIEVEIYFRATSIGIQKIVLLTSYNHLQLLSYFWISVFTLCIYCRFLCRSHRGQSCDRLIFCVWFVGIPSIRVRTKNQKMIELRTMIEKIQQTIMIQKMSRRDKIQVDDSIAQRRILKWIDKRLQVKMPFLDYACIWLSNLRCI